MLIHCTWFFKTNVFNFDWKLINLKFDDAKEVITIIMMMNQYEL